MGNWITQKMIWTVLKSFLSRKWPYHTTETGSLQSPVSIIVTFTLTQIEVHVLLDLFKQD